MKEEVQGAYEVGEVEEVEEVERVAALSCED